MSTFERCDVCGQEFQPADEPPPIGVGEMGPRARGFLWRLLLPPDSGTTLGGIPGLPADVCTACITTIRSAIYTAILEIRETIAHKGLAPPTAIETGT